MWISHLVQCCTCLLAIGISKVTTQNGFEQFTNQNSNSNGNGFNTDFNNYGNEYKTQAGFGDSVNLNVNGGFKSTDTPATLKEIEESYIDSLIQLNHKQTNNNAESVNANAKSDISVTHFTPQDSIHNAVASFKNLQNFELRGPKSLKNHFTKGQVSDAPIGQSDGFFEQNQNNLKNFNGNPYVREISDTSPTKEYEYGYGHSHDLKTFFRPSEEVISNFESPSMFTGFKPSFGPPTKSKSVDISQPYLKAFDDYYKQENFPGYPKESNVFKEVSLHMSPYDDSAHAHTESNPLNIHKRPFYTNPLDKVILIKTPRGPLREAKDTDSQVQPSTNEKSYPASNKKQTESDKPTEPSVYYLNIKKSADGQLTAPSYEIHTEETQAGHSKLNSNTLLNGYTGNLKSAGNLLYPTLATPTSYYPSFTVASPTAPTYANSYTLAPSFKQTLKSPKVNFKGDLIPSDPIHTLSKLIQHDNGFMLTYAPTFAPYTSSTADPSSFTNNYGINTNEIEELLKAYGIEPSQVEISKQLNDDEEIIQDHSNASESETDPKSQLGQEDQNNPVEKFTRSALVNGETVEPEFNDISTIRTRGTTTKLPSSNLATKSVKLVDSVKEIVTSTTEIPERFIFAFATKKAQPRIKAPVTTFGTTMRSLRTSAISTSTKNPTTTTTKTTEKNTEIPEIVSTSTKKTVQRSHQTITTESSTTKTTTMTPKTTTITEKTTTQIPETLSTSTKKSEKKSKLSSMEKTTTEIPETISTTTEILEKKPSKASTTTESTTEIPKTLSTSTKKSKPSRLTTTTENTTTKAPKTTNKRITSARSVRAHTPETVKSTTKVPKTTTVTIETTTEIPETFSTNTQKSEKKSAKSTTEIPDIVSKITQKSEQKSSKRSTTENTTTKMPVTASNRSARISKSNEIKITTNVPKTFTTQTPKTNKIRKSSKKPKTPNTTTKTTTTTTKPPTTTSLLPLNENISDTEAEASNESQEIDDSAAENYDDYPEHSEPNHEEQEQDHLDYPEENTTKEKPEVSETEENSKSKLEVSETEKHSKEKPEASETEENSKKKPEASETEENSKEANKSEPEVDKNSDETFSKEANSTLNDDYERLKGNGSLTVPLFFESARMPNNSKISGNSEEIVGKTNTSDRFGINAENMREANNSEKSESKEENAGISNTFREDNNDSDYNKSEEVVPSNEENESEEIPLSSKEIPEVEDEVVPISAIADLELSRKIRIKPSVARKLKGHKRIKKVKKSKKNLVKAIEID